MSALSGREIKERMLAPVESRLVVSPLLEPDEQVRDDQASVDIRLGFSFALISPSLHGAVDEFARSSQEEVREEITDLYKLEYIPFGGRIIIHPHQFILASSFEYIRLPYNLTGNVVGRSTWGRLGLIVATAIGIHPFFSGTLALELRNLGETPLVLYPGHSVAQIFISEVPGATQKPSGFGQYSGAVDLFPRDMSSELTHSKIEAYIQAYRDRNK